MLHQSYKTNHVENSQKYVRSVVYSRYTIISCCFCLRSMFTYMKLFGCRYAHHFASSILQVSHGWQKALSLVGRDRFWKRQYQGSDHGSPILWPASPAKQTMDHLAKPFTITGCCTWDSPCGTFRYFFLGVML